jgi:transposase
MTIVAIDETGEVIERKDIPTKCRNRVREYFASYGDTSQVVVESVGFYQWFWELVHPNVGRLVLADPAAVKAFTGRKAKTDRNDALLLATLLREDRLPMAYVPQENIRELRDLVRFRHSLAKSLALERRQLRWISLKNNLPGPAVLTSDRAQKWLLANEEKMPRANRLAARHRLDHIVRLEREVADVEREIADFVKEDAGIARRVELVDTIPGVGFVTAVTIVAETGDITRFDNIDQLSSYAGLAPRVSQSGETVHHGHISKQGPPILRWVLQQAAWVAIRTDPNARRIFARISKRAGAKKAATAMARKLLSYAWSVCRRNEPFQWPESKN